MKGLLFSLTEKFALQISDVPEKPLVRKFFILFLSILLKITFRLYISYAQGCPVRSGLWHKGGLIKKLSLKKVDSFPSFPRNAVQLGTVACLTLTWIKLKSNPCSDSPSQSNVLAIWVRVNQAPMTVQITGNFMGF